MVSKTGKYDKREIFESMPVPKALAALAIPTIVSQLITMIYNFADTFFIGRTNDPYKVAAATLAFLLYFNLNALSNLFGVGGGSLISRLLGRKMDAEARTVCAFSFYAAILITAAYSLCCFVWRAPLLRLLGASDQTLGYASSYVFWVVVIGGIPSSLSMTMAHLLRSEGYAGYASFGLGMGGILNTLLDPLFMFVLLKPGMEVTGAALATMISNLCTLSFFAVIFVRLRGKTVLSASPGLVVSGARYIGEILATGFPSALTSFIASISKILIYNLTSHYGDISVAAIGIAKKIDMLPMNVGMGISQGMMPLVAYNYASGDHKRMNAAARCARSCGIIFACLCVLAYQLLTRPIITLFIKDPETVALGVRLLRICCLSMPFMVCSFQISYIFQAVGKGPQSLFLAVCRQGFILTPILFLLDHFLGLYGIAWTQPCADVITLVIAVLLYRRFLRTLDLKAEGALMQEEKSTQEEVL